MDIKYRDLDLNFTKHPITNDVSQIINSDAVKRSVQNLIFLQLFDKPFHPEINARISSLLFEHSNTYTQEQLKEYITDILTKYEPRITNLYVSVGINPDNNTIAASIQFRIINLNETISLQVPLVRSR